MRACFFLPPSSPCLNSCPALPTGSCSGLISCWDISCAHGVDVWRKGDSVLRVVAHLLCVTPTDCSLPISHLEEGRRGQTLLVILISAWESCCLLERVCQWLRGWQFDSCCIYHSLSSCLWVKHWTCIGLYKQNKYWLVGGQRGHLIGCQAFLSEAHKYIFIIIIYSFIPFIISDPFTSFLHDAVAIIMYIFLHYY